MRENFINTATLTTTAQQAHGRYVPSIVPILYLDIDVVEVGILVMNISVSLTPQCSNL